MQSKLLEENSPSTPCLHKPDIKWHCTWSWSYRRHGDADNNSAIFASSKPLIFFIQNLAVGQIAQAENVVGPGRQGPCQHLRALKPIFAPYLYHSAHKNMIILFLINYCQYLRTSKPICAPYLYHRAHKNMIILFLIRYCQHLRTSKTICASYLYRRTHKNMSDHITQYLCIMNINCKGRV